MFISIERARPERAADRAACVLPTAGGDFIVKDVFLLGAAWSSGDGLAAARPASVRGLQ